jgi:hypothetical protein
MYKISENNLQVNDKHWHTEPNIQSTAGNEQKLAANTPYILYKNRANYTETLRALHTAQIDKPTHQQKRNITSAETEQQNIYKIFIL